MTFRQDRGERQHTERKSPCACAAFYNVCRPGLRRDQLDVLPPQRFCWRRVPAIYFCLIRDSTLNSQVSYGKFALATGRHMIKLGATAWLKLSVFSLILVCTSFGRTSATSHPVVHFDDV